MTRPNHDETRLNALAQQRASEAQAKRQIEAQRRAQEILSRERKQREAEAKRLRGLRAEENAARITREIETLNDRLDQRSHPNNPRRLRRERALARLLR